MCIRDSHILITPIGRHFICHHRILITPIGRYFIFEYPLLLWMQDTISLLNTGLSQNPRNKNQNSWKSTQLWWRPAASRLVQVKYVSSGFKKGDIYWIRTGWVVFLGKIKEYLACKQPNKQDKIPSKVTREGLKWKSDCSWKVSRNLVDMHQNGRFRWKVHNNIIRLRSFSSLGFGLGRHIRSCFTKKLQNAMS